MISTFQTSKFPYQFYAMFDGKNEKNELASRDARLCSKRKKHWQIMKL